VGRAIGILAAMVACGRIGFDSAGATSDGALGDGAHGAGDAAAAGPACGTIARFSDPFTATTWSQTIAPGYSVVVAANRLELDFPASAPSNTTSIFSQKIALDVRGACTTFEQLGVPNASAPAGAVSQLDVATGNVSWVVENNLLSAVFAAGTMSATIHQIAYNATSHRYLQLQESAGTLYWATSADKVTFAPFASTASGPSVASATIVVGVSTVGAATNAGSAVWGPVTVVGP
jgi:hypothetical protein